MPTDLTRLRVPRYALVLAALATAVGVTGCDSGRPSDATQLSGVLLQSVGEEGFTPSAAATGPMDVDTAAQSTTLRSEVLRGYLEENDFRSGFARVLTRDEEFVTLLAFQFEQARAASGLVDLVLDGLSTSIAFQPYDDPAVPGSRGFTLTSDVGGQVRFCVGEWFVVAARAYAVTRCAPFVLSVPAVTGIALALHGRATAGGQT